MKHELAIYVPDGPERGGECPEHFLSQNFLGKFEAGKFHYKFYANFTHFLSQHFSHTDICAMFHRYMCYTCRPVNYRLLDRRAAGVVISHRSWRQSHRHRQQAQTTIHSHRHQVTDSRQCLLDTDNKHQRQVRVTDRRHRLQVTDTDNKHRLQDIDNKHRQ